MATVSCLVGFEGIRLAFHEPLAKHGQPRFEGGRAELDTGIAFGTHLLPLLIEPSAMVVEGIGSQQIPRLLLARAHPLHSSRTKLWAFSQPGEQVAYIDIVI